MKTWWISAWTISKTHRKLLKNAWNHLWLALCVFSSSSFFRSLPTIFLGASVHSLKKKYTVWYFHSVYFGKVNKCCVCVCLHHFEGYYWEQHLHPVDNNWHMVKTFKEGKIYFWKNDIPNNESRTKKDDVKKKQWNKKKYMCTPRTFDDPILLLLLLLFRRQKCLHFQSKLCVRVSAGFHISWQFIFLTIFAIYFLLPFYI